MSNVIQFPDRELSIWLNIRLGESSFRAPESSSRTSPARWRTTPFGSGAT
jgi:hypothetical protein